MYYLLPDKYKNIWLCFASIIFAISGRNSFIWFFLLTTGFTYLVLTKLNQLPKKISKKKIIIWTVFIELVMFVLFVKDMKQIHLIFPVCYMIVLLSNIKTMFDFYQNKRKTPKLFEYILYASCFSKLLLGPVLSYYEMEQEIKCRKIKKENITDGCFLFLKGLFENVLFVGMLAKMNQELLSNGTILSTWILLITTLLQITFVMMSYSNMSFGLNQMLGFSFPVETSYPLCLSNLKYFFTSWHASIAHWWDQIFSTFMNKIPFFIQLMLYLFLFSTCYGFNYQFTLWFLSIGCFMLIGSATFYKNKNQSKWNYVINFLFLTISSIFLVRPDFFKTMKDLFTLPFWNGETKYLLSAYGILFIIALLIQSKLIQKLTCKLENKIWYLFFRMFGYLILLWFTIIALISGMDSSIWFFRI